MWSTLLSILSQVAISIVTALLSERVIKRAIVLLLQWLAKKSDNDVDDAVVAEIEKALFPEQPKAEQPNA